MKIYKMTTKNGEERLVAESLVIWEENGTTATRTYWTIIEGGNEAKAEAELLNNINNDVEKTRPTRSPIMLVDEAQSFEVYKNINI